MAIPPPIDPRQLAAEIEASVSEFNRLAALAATMGVVVAAELWRQDTVEGAARPVLRVQVIAP
jgi:hypothetical protein